MNGCDTSGLHKASATKLEQPYQGGLETAFKLLLPPDCFLGILSMLFFCFLLPFPIPSSTLITSNKTMLRVASNA